MANAIYPKAKEQFLQGGINLLSVTVKVALIDTSAYTYSSAHEFYSSVSGVVGTPQTLVGKSVTNGQLAADSVTWTALTGNTAEALLVYVDSGNPSTSRLIAYQDTGVTGLPLTPNGGTVTLNWDTVTNKIFLL